jgi:DNA-directed RNA polymerase
VKTITALVAAVTAIPFYSTPARQEWVAPLALALFRKARGLKSFAPNAVEFAAKHGGVYACAAGTSVQEGFNFVFQLLLTWADAGIITLDRGNNIVFQGEFRDEAMEPITPMLTEPAMHADDFGGQGNRALCSGRPHRFLSERHKDALDVVQGTAYAVNHRVLEFANQMANEGAFSDSKMVMERRALAFANEHLADGQPYWLPVFVDWRGRIYTDSGAILSYQGSDLHRALCWRHKPKAVDTNGKAWSRFLASVGKEYGVTTENYLEVLNGNVHGKKPFCTFAAAVAIDEVLRTGESAYIWQQDAKCSGMGHIACIMRDRDLARRCALLGEIEDKDDLYTVTASGAIKHKRFFTFNDESYNLSIVDLLDNEDVCKELGSRSTAKKPVMVIAYGSSVMGIAQGWCEDAGVNFDDIATRLPEGSDGGPIDLLDLVEWDDLDVLAELPIPVTVAAAKAAGVKPGHLFLCLGNAYSRSLQEQFPSIAKFISHMKRIAARTHKATGFAAGWRSPTGMVCFAQPYQLGPVSKTSIIVNGKTIRVMTPEVVTKSGEAGQAPNVVHSIDVTVAVDSILELAEHGIEIDLIHDSWGSYIADGIQVCDAVRDAQVSIHRNLNFKDEEERAGIKSSVLKGTWDLNEIAPTMIG